MRKALLALACIVLCMGQTCAVPPLTQASITPEIQQACAGYASDGEILHDMATARVYRQGGYSSDMAYSEMSLYCALAGGTINTILDEQFFAYNVASSTSNSSTSQESACYACELAIVNQVYSE